MYAFNYALNCLLIYIFRYIFVFVHINLYIYRLIYVYINLFISFLLEDYRLMLETRSVCLNDLESYADGRVSTWKGDPVRQVKGYRLDEVSSLVLQVSD
jgi:hypothetical protein